MIEYFKSILIYCWIRFPIQSQYTQYWGPIKWNTEQLFCLAIQLKEKQTWGAVHEEPKAIFIKKVHF